MELLFRPEAQVELPEAQAWYERKDHLAWRLRSLARPMSPLHARSVRRSHPR